MLLRQIVEYFREDAPAYLRRMHAAVDAGDAAGVEYAAHCLHGLVANFAAEVAALAAQRVQEIAHSGDLLAVTQAVSVLDDEITKLETALVREASCL